MPRTPEANARIRQAARTQILAATTAFFLAKGYHATSIDDVAKAAHVSKGLLYHYFAAKEDLLAAMVDLRIEGVATVMREAAAQPTPAAQLRHIVEGALDNVQREPAVFRFYLNLSTQPHADIVVATHAARLNAEAEKQFTVQTAMFACLGAVHPRERSLYFSATLQGVMLLYSTYPETFPLEAVQAQVTAEFCTEPHETR